MMTQGGSREIPKKFAPWLLLGMVLWWLALPAAGAVVGHLHTHSSSGTVLGALFGFCVAVMGALCLIVAAFLISQHRENGRGNNSLPPQARN